MLNNKTKKELKKMKFDDLKNMFELLTDDTEKKRSIYKLYGYKF